MPQDTIVTEAGRETLPAEVKVWDLFVRFFHWSLVALVAFAYVTGDEWTGPHNYAGYAILALITARILWGFVGTKHARFSDFVRGPRAVLAYLHGLRWSQAPRMLGHNPLGGLMILALLAALLATGVTGYMLSIQPEGAKEAKEWLKELHEAMANGTMLLVALHVAGVAYSSVAEGENLAKAMITGRKRG